MYDSDLEVRLGLEPRRNVPSCGESSCDIEAKLDRTNRLMVISGKSSLVKGRRSALLRLALIQK